MTYGELIKKLCDKKGISLRKVENDLGLTNGFIRTQKDNIKLDKLADIANYLGISAYDIACTKLKADFGKEDVQFLIDVLSDDILLDENFDLLDDNPLEYRLDEQNNALVEYIYETEGNNFDSKTLSKEDKMFASVFAELKPWHKEILVRYLKSSLVEEIETGVFKSSEE